jgi:hypothetical protein
MHVTIVEEVPVDAVTFDALSRRASLATLGAAGVAVLAMPTLADAKKKKKGKKKGDVNKRCKAQAETWVTFVETECGTGPECQEFIACGVPLRTCNFSAYFDCYLAATAP